jgi:hypothetical protein
LVELLARGRRRGMKHRAALRVSREDAIEDHRVEVDVEVDARPDLCTKVKAPDRASSSGAWPRTCVERRWPRRKRGER